MLTALNGWRTPDEFPAAGRWQGCPAGRGRFFSSRTSDRESLTSLTRLTIGMAKGIRVVHLEIVEWSTKMRWE